MNMIRRCVTTLQNNKQAIRMSKVSIALILVVLLISFSSLVSAIKQGEIKVFVKDQAGNNVIENEHLVGNLTVELLYRGKVIGNKTFPKDANNITFQVNHTGPYTIRTVATLGNFIDTYGCDIVYVGEGNYLPRCSNKCPDETSTVSVDEYGIYKCIETFSKKVSSKT